MDLQQYAHAVRAYWWAIVLPVLVGLAVGVVLTARAEPRYRASLTFFVATPEGDAAPSAAVQGNEFAQSRVNSYLKLLSTDRLAGQVIAASGLDLTPGQVKRMMGAHADVDTVLLTATVTDSSQARVTRVADAVSTQFVALVDQLENQGTGQAAVHLELVSGPSVRQVPPQRTLTIGIPALLGLAVGLALAWLLELRDKTIRSDAELRALDAGPILGLIPFDRALRHPAERRPDASTAGTESFRQVRTNLEFLDVNRPARVLVVTSSAAEEGKTTTTVNLALTFAAAGRNVLVVEADLRQPTVVDHFPAPEPVGLTDVIMGRTGIDAALQDSAVDRITVLLSGALPPNPSELLGTDAMVELLENVRYRFDVVVVNTPPLLPVTDAAVVAAHADGVILVVRAGRTTRQHVVLAINALHAVGARILGLVLNMAPGHRGPGYTAYWRTGPARSDNGDGVGRDGGDADGAGDADADDRPAAGLSSGPS